MAQPRTLIQTDTSADRQLFPIRLRTREMPPGGAHIEFVTHADDGGIYFCKSDRAGFPCRMREAFYSQLAGEIALTTPDFRIVEDEETGETFFGSRRMPSTASDFARRRFLRTERRDELGRVLPFPSRWFSQLYAFDLFVGNVDRSADNIIGIGEGRMLQLRPIDFSASNLAECGIVEFPDESTETVLVARNLRTVHSFFADSAIQTVEQLKAVPPSVVNGFFEAMPSEWIDVGERERINEIWTGPGLAERLNALRSGIENGRLL